MADVNVAFNFRSIKVIPNAEELADICLSKTQRKTPSEIHKSYPITRIRQFYMRKVKFLQQTFHDKLEEILNGFPHINRVHPFHADILNILYDKDHYKIALGQLNICKKLIDKIATDYLKLLKYSESLYRSKTIKVAAFGRMTKLISQQKETLEYLESVRQHITRLPSINPTGRILLLAGFPNVGKSSFLNSVSNANVDVQPYPFTTRSIFVGQTTAFKLPWQVLDTPGVLDKPLAERNSIEMLSITALAHLKASVIYFMDPSEMCGYTVEEQLDLFESIKPLFTDKPLLLALNKCDQMRFADMSQERQDKIKELCTNKDNPIPCFEISTQTNENISKLKLEACKMLLQKRVEAKLKSYNKAERAAEQIKVYYPECWTQEQVTAHQAKTNALALKKETKIELDQETILSIAGQMHKKPQSAYKLPNPDEKFDKIPEFYMGYNVLDFTHPEFKEQLAEVIAIERERDQSGYYDLPTLPDDEESKQRRVLAKAIRDHKIVARSQSRLKNSNNKSGPVSRQQKFGNLVSKAKNHDKPGETQVFSRYFKRNLHQQAINSAMQGNKMDIEKTKDGVATLARMPPMNKKIEKFMKNKNIEIPGVNGVAATRANQANIPLAKKSTMKINKQNVVAKNKAYTKFPKHLYSGQVNSIGKRDYR